MASDDKVLACGDRRAHEKVLKLIA
jgi:hypothetical protein